MESEDHKMAYICLNCGHIFEEGEQENWSESRGEFWGHACSESMSGCPLCKGDYEEAVECEICGSEHLEEDLNGGVCDECINNYRYNVDVCYKIGSNDTDNVKLNCFLASMFDKEEIEQILLKELKEAKKYRQIDCEKFIESDRDWFGERLAEEVKKNENGKG